jgi:hypothetical protein
LTSRQRITVLKIFFGGHLVIVFLGSSLIPFDFVLEFLAPAVSTYSAWTGGGHGYSFFSPNPGNQVIAEASWRDSASNEIETEYFGVGGSEFQRRVSSTLTNFLNADVYDLAGRTVAAWVIGHHQPRPDHVLVRLVEIIPPPLHEPLEKATRREVKYEAVFTAQ